MRGIHIPDRPPVQQPVQQPATHLEALPQQLQQLPLAARIQQGHSRRVLSLLCRWIRRRLLRLHIRLATRGCSCRGPLGRLLLLVTHLLKADSQG